MSCDLATKEIRFMLFIPGYIFIPDVIHQLQACMEKAVSVCV